MRAEQITSSGAIEPYTAQIPSRVVMGAVCGGLAHDLNPLGTVAEGLEEEFFGAG